MKEEFLNNEFWILIFGGGFQRANIYKKDYSEKVRSVFRDNLRAYIEKIVKDVYNKEVSEAQYLANIKSIVHFSKEKENNGHIIPINFGIAQKLLNLYLKYQWCLDIIPTPPHFPVDRLIQEFLNKEVKNTSINRIMVEAWTKFQNEEKYLQVIRLAESIRDNKPEYQKMTLAELELILLIEEQMNETTHKKLLKDTQRILKHQKEIAILKGETFNVFSILKMESKENATHSAFLGELLDSKGSHNLGNTFLRLFLETFDIEDFDASSGELHLEKYIGPRDDKTKTGGRIDIFIEDNENRTICIENKIYAVDQYAQIERYCNFNKEKNQVLYLTLDGANASDDSVGEKVSGEDFIPINYKYDIVKWLKLCVKEASEIPILRETILQYIILIKKLTNQLSDTKMEKEIKNLIKTNYLEAKTISSNIEAVELEYTSIYLNEIGQRVIKNLNSNDSLWSFEVSEDLTQPWTGLYIYHKDWTTDMRVQLQGDSRIHVTRNHYGLVAHKASFDREALFEKLKPAGYNESDWYSDQHWPLYNFSINFGDIEERAKLFDDILRTEMVEQVAKKLIEICRLCETPLINFPKI